MDEDARDVELSTISAIYPEVRLDDDDPHSFSIELPVTLSKPLTVLFPAVVEAANLAPNLAAVDSQELLNLPALQVNITLPDEYPQDRPPSVAISTSPPWLSDDILRKLEADVVKLWEDIGHDQVIFTYIDDLQQATDDVFGLVDSKGTLEVTPEHKIALLDYDGNARRLAFEKGTFECGICLDPKKGIACHKMLDCGHVFCTQCLQDFYNNAITEGNIAAVICLSPNCASEREKDAAKENGRKVKTFISPSELLQIPMHQDAVKRYVMLKHKNKIESDKNTIYCPRSWCQGAARSKKHKKPEGLEVLDSDDEEDEDTGLLAICEDCGFAFCSRCCQGWHGEFERCFPKQFRMGEITEEEKASLEYLRLHSTPCPTCWAPCQKSRGCNHMQCFKCGTHFCYLCSAWLDPSNPYKHFNTAPTGEQTSCYMRLWELEGGDGDDVGIEYEGGDAMRNANVVAGEYGEDLDRRPRIREEPRQEALQQVPVLQEVPQAPMALQQPELPQQPPPERRAAVAREGPLVLRIEGDLPAAPHRREDDVRQAGFANQRANAGNRGGHRGNRRGGGAGANQRNNHNRAHGPGRANNNRARGGRGRPAAVPDPEENADINPEQAAWIRHFVALALNDEEDLVDWDSDEA
ncbi:RWD-domain-containing protein [Xylaria nigripes]|nr:RWD-domain-containing protein [Xylaria nigripes]